MNFTHIIHYIYVALPFYISLSTKDNYQSVTYLEFDHSCFLSFIYLKEIPIYSVFPTLK